MDQIDALVMGRNTFEAVCGFDVEWPYSTDPGQSDGAIRFL
jgi:hypothetical protein